MAIIRRRGTLHGSAGSARRICGRELLWWWPAWPPRAMTVVDEIDYIQRGYENFEEQAAPAWALQIEKVSSEKEIQKFMLKVS